MYNFVQLYDNLELQDIATQLIWSMYLTTALIKGHLKFILSGV